MDFKTLHKGTWTRLIGWRLYQRAIHLPSEVSSSACSESFQGRETVQRRERVGLSPSQSYEQNYFNTRKIKLAFIINQPNGLFSISSNTEIRSEKTPLSHGPVPPQVRTVI